MNVTVFFVRNVPTFLGKKLLLQMFITLTFRSDEEEANTQMTGPAMSTIVLLPSYSTEPTLSPIQGYLV